MADRALFEAFQKVKDRVEDVVSETRKKEEKARAAEEAKRLAAKKAKAAPAPQPRFVSEEKKTLPATPSKEAKPVASAPESRISAAAFSPTGGFGSALADAAVKSGASFRMSNPGKKKSTPPAFKPNTPKVNEGTEAQGEKRTHQGGQKSVAAGKPENRQAQSKHHKSNQKDNQKPQRENARPEKKERPPRLTYEERRNPVPAFQLMPGLPVSEHGEELVAAIRQHRAVIVCGETGSGKTTQLPKIAMMAGRGEHGMIAHTQPRRIAASSIAQRIADELKTPIGEVVGYKVRFTDKTHPGATIKLMTDGILLAETQHDPLLRAYDTIIIDEAHERSINIDFLLGYLKRLLAKRPDLKVIVTSATIDAERFAEHFTINGRPAPIFSISGRTYPVEIRYRPTDDVDEEDDKTLMDAIDDAVSECESVGRGDILVFLPGEREIHEAADVLRKSRRPTTEILPLFARLSAADQERVFRPSGARRIILATNVAETSITVSGIRFVVDTGLARVKRYSYRSKVEQLQIEPVSQASANQRAGRCGRVADGVCIRLYSEEDFARRAPFTDPEIMRSNLAAVILRAKALKLGDIREFPFVQTPTNKAINDGYAILQELDAVNEEGNLTRVGAELAKLPVDPRLARMLLEGHRLGSLNEMLIICSGLSVQDPRERPLDAQQAADEAHKKLADERSDFLSYVKLWQWVEKAKANKESNRKFEQELRQRFLSPRRLREWRDVERQLAALTEELSWRRNTAEATYEEVHKALLSGLLGNIGSKAVESDFRAPPYLGTFGVKFWIWPGSVKAKKGGRWVMSSELVETTKLYARCVADIEAEWIEAAAGNLIKKSWSEPHWEKHRGEVMAMERGTLYGLTIYQQRSVSFERHDLALSRELFIRQALVEGNWDAQAPFYQHNQRLIREIEELEHKTRRPDVLVDDELQFAFYDAVIPSDIANTRSLLAWLKQGGKEVENSLKMTRDALMRHDASGVTNRYYPKTIEMAGVSMALAYHFEPGNPRDGLTVTVPLFALNQLDAVQAEWLVPGMVKEKAQFLIKSLPQKIRRHCVPVQDYAQQFFLRTEEGEAQPKGFFEVLAADIREQTGVPCTTSDFKLEQLPAHLVMNFKVVDEHGRQLAMGRNLAQLRAELGEQAQETFKAVAAQDAMVVSDLEDAVTDWTFGELPELMEINRKGQTLIGHPALVDKGDVCAIEVFDDPNEAKREHRRGLLRLFRLVLKEQVRFVERTVRDLGRVQMQAATVPGLSRLFESIDTLSKAIVNCALEATALQEPWPQNEETFKARREDVKGRLTLMAGEVVRLLSTIVAEAAPIMGKLKKLSDIPAINEDIQNEFQWLFKPGFLENVPLSQLQHYPRYMKAIQYRLDRYRDDPMRDYSRQQEIAQLRIKWQRAVIARRGQLDPQLEDFGWLLQELRVSLFAQQLRTPMPVSVKRLERIWSMIEHL